MSPNECAIEGFGRCPNPDVSGILVRVSAYLANLLLGIVIMYDPEEASSGVWTQLLTVYSLLISAIISIYTKGLTRFHSEMTIFLVLSPLSFTLGIYAILGFCGRPHRLDSVLSSRREHLLPRLAVIGFWIIAFILIIFTSVSSDGHFTPPTPCDGLVDKGSLPAIIYSVIFIPYVGAALVILTILSEYVDGDGASLLLLILAFTPMVLLIITLVSALIKSRRSLSEEVKTMNINGKLRRFWARWDLFGKRYPFLHFNGIFFVPMIYWVILNEIRLLNTPDNIFSPSFGQVLAVFVVLEPFLQGVKMFPRATRWFMNLAFVRRVTGRPKEFVPIVDLEEEDRDTVSLKSWDKHSG
ncbi:hypothetical protein B0H12DRAFT_1114046 [Mycena haematopus]|nr:hypothetical protein B0H12DRAFT_1114046 [Mycena haematopus]